MDVPAWVVPQRSHSLKKPKPAAAAESPKKRRRVAAPKKPRSSKNVVVGADGYVTVKTPGHDLVYIQDAQGKFFNRTGNPLSVQIVVLYYIIAGVKVPDGVLDIFRSEVFADQVRQHL